MNDFYETVEFLPNVYKLLVVYEDSHSDGLHWVTWVNEERGVEKERLENLEDFRISVSANLKVRRPEYLVLIEKSNNQRRYLIADGGIGYCWRKSTPQRMDSDVTDLSDFVEKLAHARDISQLSFQLNSVEGTIDVTPIHFHQGKYSSIIRENLIR